VQVRMQLAVLHVPQLGQHQKRLCMTWCMRGSPSSFCSSSRLSVLKRCVCVCVCVCVCFAHSSWGSNKECAKERLSRLCDS